jgi:hypothetical protein
VHPSLLDKEMVTPFANTLKASYYEHVMGSSTQKFTDAVTPGHCGDQLKIIWIMEKEQTSDILFF